MGVLESDFTFGCLEFFSRVGVLGVQLAGLDFQFNDFFDQGFILTFQFVIVMSQHLSFIQCPLVLGHQLFLSCVHVVDLLLEFETQLDFFLVCSYVLAVLIFEFDSQLGLLLFSDFDLSGIFIGFFKSLE